MLVGNGLIANTFSKYKEDSSIVIFASGVSNSLEIREQQFEREKNLLTSCLIAHAGSRFIYFSTCSIYDPSLKNSPYILHKQSLERLIAANHKNYLIVRLPNIVGKQGNKNTLINFLVSSVDQSTKINIWKNSTRNILDQCDMFFLVGKLLEKKIVNKIINVAAPVNYQVTDILREVESHLCKKANYSLIEKGADYEIDISDIIEIIHELKKDFSISYIKEILNKYY